MADLGVAEPVEDVAVDDRTTADPRAEGQVDEGRQSPGRSPATLGQGRGIHVRVESHR